MPAKQPHDSRGQNYAEETLVASAARTTSSNSATIPGWGLTKSVRAQLEVTATSGTGETLDVTLEDTLDGTNWNTIGSFTQAAGATREVINITAPFADRVRVKWVIAGTDTPTFTFSVKAASEVDPR